MAGVTKKKKKTLLFFFGRCEIFEIYKEEGCVLNKKRSGNKFKGMLWAYLMWNALLLGTTYLIRLYLCVQHRSEFNCRSIAVLGCVEEEPGAAAAAAAEYRLDDIECALRYNSLDSGIPAEYDEDEVANSINTTLNRYASWYYNVNYVMITSMCSLYLSKGYGAPKARVTGLRGSSPPNFLNIKIRVD